MLTIFFFYIIIQDRKINKESRNLDKTTNKKKVDKSPINIVKKEKMYLPYNEKCYLSLENSNLKIIHIIFTRFLMSYYKINGFPKKLKSKYYLQNGIRVMKKYLFPSLENQSCKNFIWILLLGDKANITYIKFLLDLNNSFESKVIYQKDIKNYMRNITKGFDVLITTSMDYDDRIYYDAVNDVRKAININKPMLLYGYKRGLYYFESDGKYYEFYDDYQNMGAINIFLSLITVLNKVNDTYIIYNLGGHTTIRKTLLEKYKSYGIKELNYEPAIFDSGDPKFVYVRQNYSVTITLNQIKLMQKMPIMNYFNLSHFYGIY